MFLYLVRHGEAKPKEEDPERPLTEIGLEQVRRAARFLQRGGLISVAEIHHSTKLRARQTAELLAGHLGLSVPIKEVPNLEPLADVAGVARTLAEASEDLMLVGHLPHLSRLASLLVAGDATLEAFTLDECGLLCLLRATWEAGASGRAVWTVKWLLPGIEAV